MPSCTMLSSSLLPCQWFFYPLQRHNLAPVLCQALPSFSSLKLLQTTSTLLPVFFSAASHTFPLQLFSPSFPAGIYFLSSHFHLISPLLSLGTSDSPFSHFYSYHLSSSSCFFQVLCSSRSIIFSISDVLPDVSFQIPFLSSLLSFCNTPLCSDSVSALMLYCLCSHPDRLHQREGAGMALCDKEPGWLFTSKLNSWKTKFIEGPLFERFLQVLMQCRETRLPQTPTMCTVLWSVAHFNNLCSS